MKDDSSPLADPVPMGRTEQPPPTRPRLRIIVRTVLANVAVATLATLIFSLWNSWSDALSAGLGLLTAAFFLDAVRLAARRWL